MKTAHTTALKNPVDGPDKIPRNTRRSREQVMTAIHAAAIAEFSESGLKGTSTQAIAARAGLTKPQLHYYIQGKEELYGELLMSVVSDWKGMFAADSSDPAKVLGDYVRSKLNVAFDKPEVSRIFTREVLDGGHNLEKFWPDSRRRTRQKVAVINQWIERGLMKPVDPHTLLMSIWAMTQFYADSAVQVQQLMAPRQTAWTPDRDRLVIELTTLILRGCGIKLPSET
ncbi:MAG: TetR family transcriptional regulator C-terminal domain-containing protein [Polaromonas sp.]|nr:TetR family transcriptional regulator C-terminal domain-containing protein [Polaromonas sp.]